MTTIEILIDTLTSAIYGGWPGASVNDAKSALLAAYAELKEEVEHERNEKLTISEVDKSTIDFMREIMTKLKQEKAELDREIANFKATLTDANLYTLKLLDRIAELEAALAAAEAEVLKLQDILAAIAYALDVTPDYPDFNYVTSTFEFVKMKLHQLRDEILKRGETIALYRDKLIAAAKNEGPVQNECVYCPRCGKKIAVVIEPKEEKNER